MFPIDMPHLSSTNNILLPQELIDNIIDHLYNDPLALSSCALVCRSWLPASRLHLFAKITLKASPSHTQSQAHAPQDLCKRLFRMLGRAPIIVGYIREVEICEGAPGVAHHSQVSDGHSGTTSTQWVATERTLPPLLRMLSNLQRLEFSAASTLHWSSLSTSLKSALCSLFTSPSLTYIRLHSWAFPNFVSLASTLCHCHNLKGLALSSTSIGDEEESNTLDENFCTSFDEYEDCSASDVLVYSERELPRSRLEVLTLDFVDFCYLGYWLLDSRKSPVDVKNLRELRVAHFMDPVVVQKVLYAVGGSLEHLHVKPGSLDVHTLDLETNSGLRSIRLTLEEPETAIPWVTSVISSLLTTSNTVLERIGLEFYTDLKKIEGWAALDSLLARPEFASSLRKVEIGLFALPTHSEFVKVKEELRGLSSRGLLQLYQLGIKSQRSSRQLTPRISRYES